MALNGKDHKGLITLIFRSVYAQHPVLSEIATFWLVRQLRVKAWNAD